MPGTTRTPPRSAVAALGLGLGASAAPPCPRSGPPPRARSAGSGSPPPGCRCGAARGRRSCRLAAKAWLIADDDSGEVLASYDAHRALPPASTLKMLFADTVLPEFAHDLRHKVTAEDLAGIPAGSSLVGIQAGTTYTVHQLWQGVFLRSGNDAVHVLASMYGGVDKTVAAMVGPRRGPSGGRHARRQPGRLSTTRRSRPRTTSRAARPRRTAQQGLPAVLRHEGRRLPAGGGKTFQIQNTDRLLTAGRHPVRGLIGVKNGYTRTRATPSPAPRPATAAPRLVTVMHPKAGYEAVYEETAALPTGGSRPVTRCGPSANWSRR
ncbi:D-alanyl-D-alanine carboxypeptidase [Streptomyces sp. KL116D]|uniref:D-alanyl-D-alanine carboxypeptidase n=1 Tax=Streptomyces sp. KL116D TaxID=3045152 RepID=UPI0035584D1C